MGRRIKIAAIQMDANPAPRDERLARAERLVQDAAEAGAELLVLPELFNVGYTYEAGVHRRAERLDGPTVTWMCDLAARLNVHLAGSLMLLDVPEVYNALLLCAPDGRMWRYDKRYPWAWERSAFRGGREAVVADTDLGRIGLMICADVAHLEMWRRYAGRVDLVLISSCPPDVGASVFFFSNGETVTLDQVGPWMAAMQGSVQETFGEMLNEQVAWLGVPAVNTVGTGHIQTEIPNGTATLLAMLPLAPWLVKYLPQAGGLQMACDFVPGCKVMDAQGNVLEALTPDQGEAFTVAEVTLSDLRATPSGSQPPSRLPRLALLISDVLLPWIAWPAYQQGVRRAWGDRMAPIEIPSRRWPWILGLGVILGLWLFKRRRGGA